MKDEVGEDFRHCIMSFVVYTSHLVLLGWWSQRGYDEMDMHVRWEIRNACRIFVRKPLRLRRVVKSRRRWECNIKTDPDEIRCRAFGSG